MNQPTAHSAAAVMVAFIRVMLESPPWWVVVLLVLADLLNLPIVSWLVWAGIALAAIGRGLHQVFRRPPEHPDLADGKSPDSSRIP